LPPHGPPATASASSGTRVRRLSTGTHRAGEHGPPAPKPAWHALLPSLAVRPREPSCWCAPRGQALTQEPCGITFQTLARREERPQRTSDTSGTAADLQERSAIRRAPWRGFGGEQHQRHGQSAAAPVPSVCAPWGADRGGKAQRLFEHVAEPTGGQNSVCLCSRSQGQSSGNGVSAAALTGLPTAALTGSISLTTRARACCGLDAAEASPRRWASWRSRG
jgi:hypothetical protein